MELPRPSYLLYYFSIILTPSGTASHYDRRDTCHLTGDPTTPVTRPISLALYLHLLYHTFIATQALDATILLFSQIWITDICSRIHSPYYHGDIQPGILYPIPLFKGYKKRLMRY